MAARTIGCLHAHYSNAALFDSAVSDNLRFIHYVEPGVGARMTGDSGFSAAEARGRLQELVQWIAACGADAVLVTCTEYCALLPDDAAPAPVLAIDEPLFADLCAAKAPLTLAFTNAGTVRGTMERLHRYAAARDVPLDCRVELIDGAYPLLTAGRLEAYSAQVEAALDRLHGDPPRQLAVMQLSMAGAARAFAARTDAIVLDPLASVVRAIQGGEVVS